MDGKMDGQIHILLHRWMDVKIDGERDRQVNTYIGREMDGWIDVWIDGQMCGLTDGRMVG